MAKPPANRAGIGPGAVVIPLPRARIVRSVTPGAVTNTALCPQAVFGEADHRGSLATLVVGLQQATLPDVILNILERLRMLRSLISAIILPIRTFMTGFFSRANPTLVTFYGGARFPSANLADASEPHCGKEICSLVPAKDCARQAANRHVRRGDATKTAMLRGTRCVVSLTPPCEKETPSPPLTSITRLVPTIMHV